MEILAFLVPVIVLCVLLHRIRGKPSQSGGPVSMEQFHHAFMALKKEECDREKKKKKRVSSIAN
jgi:hypothetical protein